MSKFFCFLFKCSTDRQNQDIARENKLSKNTFTSWCFIIRETIQDHLLENRDLLGGMMNTEKVKFLR
jgi:predicted DNA-binding protein